MALTTTLTIFTMILTHLLQSVLAAPAGLSVRQAAPAGVPSYVTQYAPVVWLMSQDPYFPSDIGSQLVHTKPEINFQPVQGVPDPLTLSNLGSLNADNGSSIYLTSLDDVTTDPSWLHGVKPDANGQTGDAKSCAIIVNDHGSGEVDAFYMNFYAYNWGGVVLGSDVDDHVGDWEHTMIRFQDGQPQAMWFSQHEFGEAFTYSCLEKQGVRPVVYSANGSHANYATTGTHDHTIPGFNLPEGPLEDHCDQGTLWDPLLGAYFYSYDASSKAFTAYDGTSPTSWLNFVGQWGDEQYPDSDPRQHKILGIDATAKFTSGPTGPEDKQLNRTDVCPTSNDAICRVQTSLGP